MKTTLFPAMLLALVLAGCETAKVQQPAASLSDVSQNIQKILSNQQQASPLTNILINIEDLSRRFDPKSLGFIIPNLADMVKGSDNSLFLLSDKTNVIANGATNYTVIIHYADLGINGGVQFSNAVKDVFNFETSLIGKNPDLSQYLNGSVLQHFVTTVGLVDNLKNAFSGYDFQTNLNANIHELLDDQLATVAENDSTNLKINVSLQGLVAAYMKAYLDGNFVDRWGTTLSEPDLTKLGDSTAVASTKVLMEALFDYINMTPIVYDPSESSTNKTPTFAAIFPALHEKISSDPDRRGVTSAECEAIKYLSGLSDDEAKQLSSLIIKSIGGASIGVKISTGDNDTLAQIISTVCEETARRSTEMVTYDLFERFQYYPTNQLFGYAPRFDTNYLVIINDTNRIIIPKDIQEAIVALLVTQDDLKALVNGGWKLTSNNITNYESLVGKILDTNGVLHSVLSSVPKSVQAGLAVKGTLDDDQKQSLVNAINQSIQTMTNPIPTDGIPLSCEASNFSNYYNFITNAATPSDICHLNYLLIRDAINALNVDKQ